MFRSSLSAQSVELRAISKSYAAGHPVLSSVDLEVQAGEFVSLLGPSGCGKSTLLRIVAGLISQDEGSVCIGGRDVDALSPRQRNVAMVFQSYALYPHMTVRDNIALPLVMARMGLWQRQPWWGPLWPGRQKTLAQIDREVSVLATSLQLDMLLDRKPAQLSGGQKQRVALARAMVRQPTAFLMDEPLSNLDAKLRLEVRDELAALHARIGATFIYVTHDQSEAMTLSSRVAVMDQGRIVQLASPRELYEKPATLEVARFVGTPRINVLLGAAVSSGLPGVHRWGLRPEHVTWHDQEQTPSASEVTWNARVRRVEHHGPEWITFLECEAAEDGSLCMRNPNQDGRAPPSIGQEVRLTVRPDRLMAFTCQGQRLI